jgi:hypothetical protein
MPCFGGQVAVLAGLSTDLAFSVDKLGKNGGRSGHEWVVEKFVENFGRICNKMENFA